MIRYVGRFPCIQGRVWTTWFSFYSFDDFVLCHINIVEFFLLTSQQVQAQLKVILLLLLQGGTDLFVLKFYFCLILHSFSIHSPSFRILVQFQLFRIVIMINGFSNPLTDESDNDKKHEPFLWCDIKCNDVCLAG